MRFADPATLAQPPSDGVAGWAIDLVDTLGGPGAGLAIALENLFPPLPSEVILPLTGFAAGQGVLSLASALFWTTLGSTVGAVALYYLGRLFGRERLHQLWAKLPLVKASDLTRTEEWFAKHGTKAVFFGRMVPIFRSLISVPAGVERMPLPTFVILTTLGSLIWNSVLVLAGYWLGDQWELVETYVGTVSKVVLVVVLVVAVVYLVTRIRNRGGKGDSGNTGRRAPRGQHRRPSRTPSRARGRSEGQGGDQGLGVGRQGAKAPESWDA